MKTIGKRSLALFLLLTLLAALGGGAGRLRWTDVGGKRHACAADRRTGSRKRRAFGRAAGSYDADLCDAFA